MQIDMHYGAIYYLANLVGIGADEAEKIAWSSQFVDDAQFGGTVQFPSGAGCICSNSAHQYVTDNLSAHGRLVWIPFHFVPDTSTKGSFLDRLKCKKNSDLASAAVQEALSETDLSLKPYRLGVALHAYADTWAHYEFSGFWSDSNLIEHVKPINVKQDLWESFKAMAGTLYSELNGKQESALGHLLADVCPDLPYLEWQYRITEGKPLIHRNNPEDYKKALQAICKYLVQYKSSTSNPQLPQMNWTVLDTLIGQQEDDPLKRLSRWSAAISTEFDRELPQYKENTWIDDALGKEWKKDKCIMADVPYSTFVKSDYWRFCEALRKHSEFIVGSLSRQGLYVF